MWKDELIMVDESSNLAGNPAPPMAGAPVPPYTAAPAGAAPKNPIVSAVVSLIIPGLGQIINGQMKKGLILLVGWIVLWIVLFIVSTVGSIILTAVTVIGGLCCCFGYILPLVVNLFAAYDAFKVAKDINAGVIVRDWMS
jgi:TM2 domain-containing membrane protein YozV